MARAIKEATYMNEQPYCEQEYWHIQPAAYLV